MRSKGSQLSPNKECSGAGQADFPLGQEQDLTIPCVGGMFQQPKLKVTHLRSEIPGVSAVGKDIDDFHTGFNSSLGNAHTRVPQNSGIRMSMRDKFQLITMNEIWQ